MRRRKNQADLLIHRRHLQAEPQCDQNRYVADWLRDRLSRWQPVGRLVEDHSIDLIEQM